MHKVRPGDPIAISAAVWNDVLDAAALAKRTRRAGVGIPDGLDIGVVRVKNTTDEDLDRFAALGISFGIGVTLEKNELAFQNEPPGKAPTSRAFRAFPEYENGRAMRGHLHCVFRGVQGFSVKPWWRSGSCSVSLLTRLGRFC